MSNHTPRLMTRPSPGGVLAIPASATRQKSTMESSTTRPPAVRLKINIRRLPPGLTEAEFEAALGEDWLVGKGRVDWAVYKPGKVSKDSAKPSRPSRAYLNLTKQEHVGALSEHVRNTTFNDAKASSRDSTLLGSPSVEYAPYGKIPHTKARRDARLGTIDQDPEFIEFLENLTNPSTKPVADQDAEIAGKVKDKVTTTPLIQYLKEKKANKGKESAAAATKAVKQARQDVKETKATSGSDKKSLAKPANASVPSPDKRSAQAIKVEKAARDAVRVLNKQAANLNKAQSPSPSPVPPTQPAPLAEKKRERGSASAAASILRRDLGIGPARGGRRGSPAVQTRPASATVSHAPHAADQSQSTQTGENAAASTSDTSHPTNSTTPTASTPSQTTTTLSPPTGPAASRLSPSKTSSSPSTNPAPPSTAPTTPPTQAFLKHANPSQGITEPLLHTAFSAHGPVKSVEIDKKKGFAYVDFESSEGLKKAIAASPIKVAGGSVVVLERKVGGRNNNPNANPNASGGFPRGGAPMAGRGGRGGGAGNAGNLSGRGGGIPMGPRGGGGGRGGSRGRGGFARGGAAPGNRVPAAAAKAAKDIGAAEVLPTEMKESEESAAAAVAATGTGVSAEEAGTE